MSAPFRDDTLLLPDEVLVAFANRQLEAAGTTTRVTSVSTREHNFVRFEGRCGRDRPVSLVAPVSEFTKGLIALRSILQVVSLGKPARWLINGQASSNTREIVFHGEHGPKLAASKASYEAWVASGFEENISAQRRAFFAAQTERVLSSGLYGDTFEVLEDGQRHPLTDDALVAPAP